MTPPAAEAASFDGGWVALDATAPSPGAVTAAELDGEELVVWRARSGGLCAMARRCPHLDWDLTEARVVGDELVCPGHGWSFDTEGHAGKRNERGRLDPKGTVPTLDVREHGGRLEARH